MSASRVFSIIEILQQILCELPPLDIFRCQRVNKTWKQLISDSPLLQYQAWLRNDIADPAYRIRAEHFDAGIYKPAEAVDYNTSRYIENVSRHLHPIILLNVLKHMPRDPRYSFDPVKRTEEDGFGGYFNLRPVLIRDLMQWYAKNKGTEHIWGKMSLYRPDARKVCWSIPLSDMAGIPVELKAYTRRERDFTYPGYHGYRFEVIKEPGEPLVLTVGDLMKKLDFAWDEWIDGEREEHYLSHDGQGCNFDRGIPAERCLEDDEEGTTFGDKMTLEEHIEQALEVASR